LSGARSTKPQTRIADIIHPGMLDFRVARNFVDDILIHRRGSHLYAMAYKKLVVAMTVFYAVAGIATAIAGLLILGSTIAAIFILGLVGLTTLMVWAGYWVILRVFSREGRQAIEITSEGVREKSQGREAAFIPWAGVKEVEIAATIVAGASLRVKGNFAEIAISNVDLMIEEKMSLREMHRAVGQTHQMRRLLDQLKAAAPHASLKMNRLARRRMKKYFWAEIDTGGR
jgi:hypothetical protein